MIFGSGAIHTGLRRTTLVVKTVDLPTSPLPHCVNRQWGETLSIKTMEIIKHHLTCRRFNPFQCSVATMVWIFWFLNTFSVLLQFLDSIRHGDGTPEIRFPSELEPLALNVFYLNKYNAAPLFSNRMKYLNQGVYFL